jgi:hypothetical protein
VLKPRPPSATAMAESALQGILNAALGDAPLEILYVGLRRGESGHWGTVGPRALEFTGLFWRLHAQRRTSMTPRALARSRPSCSSGYRTHGSRRTGNAHRSFARSRSCAPSSGFACTSPMRSPPNRRPRCAPSLVFFRGRYCGPILPYRPCTANSPQILSLRTLSGRSSRASNRIDDAYRAGLEL